MTLKDRIKGCGSPVSNNSSPRNSNSLSISSKNIDIILWYFRTRNADDKSCQLLRQITGRDSSYSDVSQIFTNEMKALIVELREKVKLIDLKDGFINITFETNNENFNIEQMIGCIKIFFEDLLAFFDIKISYDNIFIV